MIKCNDTVADPVKSQTVMADYQDSTHVDIFNAGQIGMLGYHLQQSCGEDRQQILTSQPSLFSSPTLFPTNTNYPRQPHNQQHLIPKQCFGGISTGPLHYLIDIP
jgi:hypothetical protein